MSDEYMILTIERMQIELKRALEDIQLLTEELQRRGPIDPGPTAVAPSAAAPAAAAPTAAAPAAVALVEPVAPASPVKKKRTFKIKKAVSPEPISASGTETVKKVTAIQPWNAFMAMIRSEMQGDSQEKPKQEDVLAMAKASKDSDPEAYKVFCTNWLENQSPSN